MPFEYQAVCIDKFGVDGHRELAEAASPTTSSMPWVLTAGFDAPLEEKKDTMKRFADTYIHSGWQEMTDSPVHLAGKRSREAAVARDKEAWLAVFADDAIVEDPIGPSHFDPEGKGHRGKEAIAKFYDMAIAPSELTFNFEKTYQCGNEEANVGNIVIRSSGYEVVAEGVFTYRVNDEGKIVALRAYWELDRRGRHGTSAAQRSSGVPSAVISRSPST